MTSDDSPNERKEMSLNLFCQFSDGTWAVPAEIIAENKAKHYAEKDTAEYKEEYEYTLSSEYELIDWAVSDMNWSDLAPHAVKISDPPPTDKEDEWMTCSKYVD